MSKCKKINNFSDYYITDNGYVYSRKEYKNPTGRIKKIKNNLLNTGYLRVSLCKNNTVYSKDIHRLVAEAFIPNPENKPQVNHKNGNKTDNRADNLEWVSCKENINHSFDVLKRKPNRSKPVFQLLNGVKIKEFESITQASNSTGFLISSIIRSCKTGKMCGGFNWQYK